MTILYEVPLPTKTKGISMLSSISKSLKQFLINNIPLTQSTAVSNLVLTTITNPYWFYYYAYVKTLEIKPKTKIGNQHHSVFICYLSIVAFISFKPIKLM